MKDNTEFVSDPEDAALFELDELFNMFGDDNVLIGSLVEQYLASLDETFELLRASIEDDANIDQARLHSHTMKGSSRSFGANRLGNEADEIETACVEGNWERVETAWESIRSTVEDTKTEAQRVMKDVLGL